MTSLGDDILSIPEGVLFQKVGEEIVFLNLTSGTYFGLDAVGTRIWELISEKRTLREIFEVMLAEYEVEPQRLEDDIVKLVAELREKGLVA